MDIAEVCKGLRSIGRVLCGGTYTPIDQLAAVQALDDLDISRSVARAAKAESKYKLCSTLESQVAELAKVGAEPTEIVMGDYEYELFGRPTTFHVGYTHKSVKVVHQQFGGFTLRSIP